MIAVLKIFALTRLGQICLFGDFSKRKCSVVRRSDKSHFHQAHETHFLVQLLTCGLKETSDKILKSFNRPWDQTEIATARRSTGRVLYFQSWRPQEDRQATRLKYYWEKREYRAAEVLPYCKHPGFKNITTEAKIILTEARRAEIPIEKAFACLSSADIDLTGCWKIQYSVKKDLLEIDNSEIFERVFVVKSVVGFDLVELRGEFIKSTEKGILQ